MSGAINGILFTEFLGFIAGEHGEDVLDDVIEAANLPHGGAYTAVRSYPETELELLAEAAGCATGQPQAEVLAQFGAALAGRFVASFPHAVNRYPSMFDFLLDLETVRQRDVRALAEHEGFPPLRVDAGTREALEIVSVGSPVYDPIAAGALAALAAVWEEPMSIRPQPDGRPDGWPDGSPGAAGRRFALQRSDRKLAA